MNKWGLSLFFLVCTAVAQNYPVRPIKLLVGVPPGGPTDAVARSIAPDLSEALGQPVVVENRSGASAVIATDAVAKAPPDGYMLAFVFITHATNPTLVAKLPYDTLKDFAPVTQVGAQTMLLVAHPSLPVSSVAQLISLAKSQPGKLDYAASDAGSAPHLAGELFKLMSGTAITAVHYKGTAPALTDTLSGHVPLMFVSNITGLPHVQAGKLKALAVTGAQRSPLAPGVPTVAESGLPGYEVVPWYGVVAPAKTPKSVIARLHAEIVKIVRKPEVKARLSGQGIELIGSRPEEFDALIRSEMVKWEKVLKAAGVHAES
ncbi:MAG TPA: tripartite tricarboxylate transporter substrate binding protein [Burkholderiales bacterium]|nr:tripartite tricarboxylate transporter substrate binding protein [Burkholderiales bacterium]